MSFTKTKKLMEEGDTVLLFLGYDNVVPVQLQHGRVHQNRYGAVKHDRLIGAPYGVKVDCSKGYLYPLQPTSELWTLALPHRTQILYTPDISMIVLQLDLKPGSVVIEAGTGSGSLSHALIRSVMPTGRLNTFEFHAERCAAASKEFEEHGFADYVTARHRDVCAEGFEPVHEADAVFLDLPSPWECVGHARRALKSGSRICSFSPCMEQVQRTCQTLTEHGFTDLTTLECLTRPFSLQKIKLPHVDFGDVAEPAAGSCAPVQTVGDSSSLQGAAKVAKLEEGAAKVAKLEEGAAKVAKLEEGAAKVAKLEEGAAKVAKLEEGASKGEDGLCTAGATTDPSQRASQPGKGQAKSREFRTGAPPEVMQGHTGFLTFASLF